MAAYNKTLGKFQLVGIPPAPRGMPQIEVAFDIDANGIIHVSAKDLGTGNEQQIKIEGGSGLKQDEVERMIKDAEAHAGEAHRLRELADAKNQAEALAYATEKSLKEHRDKLDEAEASTIEGRIMELRRRSTATTSPRSARRPTRSRRRRTSWPRPSTRRRPRPSRSRQARRRQRRRPSDDEVIEDAEVVDEEAPTS